ncbi:MAG: ParA family protein [Pseudoflavonifractor sp.]
MKTIAIVNMKGGVGKTVTAINLAAILSTEHGQRVLLVDADAQGSATKSLLPAGDYNTLAMLMTGIPAGADYLSVLYPSTVRNLDVLPADEELRNLELNSTIGGSRCNLGALWELRNNLIEDDRYDYVVPLTGNVG